MSSAEFYQEHLNRVSRSFAFCIEELKEPLRSQIGLAYILCRIVDTVEDSLWKSKKDQLLGFSEFLDFLQTPPANNQVRNWIERFPQSIPPGERLLLDDSGIFFADLHRLEPSVRTVLIENISNMTRGMAHYSGEFQKVSQKSPKKNIEAISLGNLQETNQYCFFVAGVVGELLTQLSEIEFKNFSVTEHTYLRAAHFGLFLQKINLLKDQMTDLTEGRKLIADRQEVRESLITHAVPALNYILEVPAGHDDFRTFCAWSLFLGLASLPYIDQSWEQQQEIKIHRMDALSVLGEVKMNIKNDSWLREKFAESLHRLGAGSPVSLTSAPWLLEIYRGPLKLTQFSALGMLPNPPRNAETDANSSASKRNAAEQKPNPKVISRTI